MKTAEDVKLAVGAHGITRWKLRECSICNYPLCYLFADGQVLYDTGCYCTRQRGGPEERSYEDVADFF